MFDDARSTMGASHMLNAEFVERLLAMIENRLRTDAPQLLAAESAGHLMGMSAKALRRADQEGKVPAPLRTGRNVRWRRQELLEWIVAGGPDRSTWEAIRHERWRDPAG